MSHNFMLTNPRVFYVEKSMRFLCWRIYACFMLKNPCVFHAEESMCFLSAALRPHQQFHDHFFMFFALNNYYVCPCRDVDLKKLLKERLFIKLALRATSRKVCSVALKTGILYQMDNTFRYIVFYMSVPKFIVFKNVYLDRINCYFCKLRGRGKSKRLSSDSIDSQPNMGFGQL